MKRIILLNLALLVFAFSVSLYILGWDTTLQYMLCDYIGYGLILTGQRMLKEKRMGLFPIYIIGLSFNLVFGIMNSSVIHVIFCAYSIYIFADNWKAWRKNTSVGDSQTTP